MVSTGAEVSAAEAGTVSAVVAGTIVDDAEASVDGAIKSRKKKLDSETKKDEKKNEKKKNSQSAGAGVETKAVALSAET